MWPRVIPDQEPPHPSIPQRSHSRGYVLASASLPNCPNQLTCENIEKPHHRPASVSPADDDLGLLPNLTPRRSQGRKLPQARLVPKPYLPACIEHLSYSTDHFPFLCL